ncbi:MAG: DUF1538 domain-containing protein [Saprospiraceae bacterium]
MGIRFIHVLFDTLLDVAPVVLLFGFFQFFIVKKPVPNVRKVIFGLILVIVGLTLFLMGLEMALFPIGEIMAEQLSAKEFIEASYGNSTDWKAYYWVYIFAFTIGFATTIAEPSLIAVAFKANEISGGKIGERSLRTVVAVGVAISLAVGTFRIVTGTPLYLYILVGYIIVIIQTIFAPRYITALAYDSGGVTTSTVTVPIVTALGLGLASVIPGRNPALDGFGLIAFASLFPIMAVLGYGQFLSLLVFIKKYKK